jgi:exopolysaccharide biosynthesis predicted pyruvyltransferase EpsI
MIDFPAALAALLRGVGAVSYVASKGNAGDALIAAATQQALEGLGIDVTPDAPVILVAGGGALIPRYECLSRVVDRLPRDRRIIVGPSTVVGFDLLRQFPNLILLAREEMTHALAKAAGVTTMLCHDAALSFDFSPWEGAEDRNSLGKLSAFRTDGESTGGALPPGNLDLSAQAGGWWQLHNCHLQARRFLTTINRYRTVETDRLHVAIAAAKLGKRVTLYPGNYHKNRAVFHCSLKGFSRARFVDAPR